MELTSVIAIAGSLVIGIGSKFAYDGIKRRNNSGGVLKAHDDSATAHPDIREDMSTMGKKITKIDDRTVGMDKKLDKLLDGNQKER